MIGVHGVERIRAIAERKGDVVKIITHCNAGRLACVAHGTATSPIYRAYAEGIPLHVWVDETRPRLQGASLTAFELREAGIPYTIIADGAAGHLMRRGAVDMAIVGCDRLTRSGDACNKIGTYMLALAARDNQVPFYVALPSSTIDVRLADGDAIPIEERAMTEVLEIRGRTDDGVASVEIAPEGSLAYNPAFDVTPARLITGIITEEGIVAPAEINETPARR
jgi:methylthioribose-1-phosphate isomerase